MKFSFYMINILISETQKNTLTYVFVKFSDAVVVKTKMPNFAFYTKIIYFIGKLEKCRSIKTVILYCYVKHTLNPNRSKQFICLEN